MFGFGPPVDRRARRAWWRRQLARQQSTNLSVAQFCRQLGVSVAAYYYWKRQAQEAPLNVPLRGPAHREPPRAVTVATKGVGPDFVPVSIVDSVPATQLEIELTNACVVRLTGPIDTSLLEAAITAAGELAGSRQGAH